MSSLNRRSVLCAWFFVFSLSACVSDSDDVARTTVISPSDSEAVTRALEVKVEGISAQRLVGEFPLAASASDRPSIAPATPEVIAPGGQLTKDIFVESTDPIAALLLKVVGSTSLFRVNLESSQKAVVRSLRLDVAVARNVQDGRFCIDVVALDLSNLASDPTQFCVNVFAGAPSPTPTELAPSPSPSATPVAATPTPTSAPSPVPSPSVAPSVSATPPAATPTPTQPPVTPTPSVSPTPTPTPISAADLETLTIQMQKSGALLRSFMDLGSLIASLQDPDMDPELLGIFDCSDGGSVTIEANGEGRSFFFQSCSESLGVLDGFWGRNSLQSFEANLTIDRDTAFQRAYNFQISSSAVNVDDLPGEGNYRVDIPGLSGVIADIADGNVNLSYDAEFVVSRSASSIQFGDVFISHRNPNLFSYSTELSSGAVRSVTRQGNGELPFLTVNAPVNGSFTYERFSGSTSPSTVMRGLLELQGTAVQADFPAYQQEFNGALADYVTAEAIAGRSYTAPLDEGVTEAPAENEDRLAPRPQTVIETPQAQADIAVLEVQSRKAGAMMRSFLDMASLIATLQDPYKTQNFVGEFACAGGGTVTSEAIGGGLNFFFQACREELGRIDGFWTRNSLQSFEVDLIIDSEMPTQRAYDFQLSSSAVDIRVLPGDGNFSVDIPGLLGVITDVADGNVDLSYRTEFVVNRSTSSVQFAETELRHLNPQQGTFATGLETGNAGSPMISADDALAFVTVGAPTTGSLSYERLTGSTNPSEVMSGQVNNSGSEAVFDFPAFSDGFGGAAGTFIWSDLIDERSYRIRLRDGVRR